MPLKLPEVDFDLVVGSTTLAAVSNDLEAADHLPDGEETQNLGGDNTTGNNLAAVDVASLL